jgi:hypothetical protein
MVRVPAPIVMIRISRLVDVGADLEGALGVGRVRSFEALQRAVTWYLAWSADAGEYRVLDRRATRTDMLAESDGIAALNVARNEPRSLPKYCQNWGGFEGLPRNLSGKNHWKSLMDGMFSPEIHATSHSDFRFRIPASPPTFAHACQRSRELRLASLEGCPP